MEDYHKLRVYGHRSYESLGNVQEGDMQVYLQNQMR
jgi:hypothetical protein